MIKCMFLPQGLIIGDVTENVGPFEGGKVKMENPCLVVTQNKGFMLVPFLQMVTETSVEIDMSEAAFNAAFSPIPELQAHYSQVFGTIITPNAGLTLAT